MTFEWEIISGSEEVVPGETGSVTFRMWVPGGWLIRNVSWLGGRYHTDSMAQSESMVFVADMSHSWGRDTTMDGVI